TIRFRDEEGKFLQSFAMKVFPRCLALSADGRLALAGCVPELGGMPPKDPAAPGEHTVHLLDLVKGRELARFEGHEHRVLRVAFTPDGKYGLSGSDKGNIRLWDLKRFAQGAKADPAVEEPAAKRAVRGLRILKEIDCRARPTQYRLARNFRFDKDWQL